VDHEAPAAEAATWSTASQLVRSWYVLGLFDGIDVGAHWSFGGFAKEAESAYFARTQKMFSENRRRYLVGLTAG